MFTNLTVISALTVVNTILLIIKAIISYRLTKQLELTRRVLDGKIITGESMLDGGLNLQIKHVAQLEAFRAEVREFASFTTHSINLMGDDMTRMGMLLKQNQETMMTKLNSNGGT